MLKNRVLLVIITIIAFNVTLIAQDSLNVTFRYTPNEGTIRSFVPGSFNNWGNNVNGRINNNDGSLLTVDAVNGFSYQVIRLRVGGGTSIYQGRPGYAYKFHEQYNASGSQWNWFSDLLNPITVGVNSDSYLEITHPLIFQVYPSNNSVIQDEAPSIWANIATIDPDPLNLSASRILFNGNDVTSFENYFEFARQLLHVPSVTNLGVNLTNGVNNFELKAVTVAGVERSIQITFNYLFSPSIIRESRPNGLEDGITIDNSSGNVSFSLFAPGKDFVYIIGDHSNWEVRPEFLMKLDEARPDSAHFWLTIDGLNDGVYRYQYLVDGDIKIPDLFSEMILDPDHDRFISASVYPNLPQYPTGQTSGVVGVFEVGKEPYQWLVPDFQRPNQHELVIYELLLRDFVNESTFDVLADTLGYLEYLGVNAIELMPVSNFDGNLSWGYNPNFQGALDKSYGTRESFKRFVDAAHSRGIAVILDVVYNHAQDKSPLIQLYGPLRSNNPFLGPGHAYNVFFHLNHDNSYIQYWLDRMNRYWLETFNIDGFRFDLSKGFASNVSNRTLLDGYNADRIRNLKRMADEIWSYDTSAYIILEHFAANAEEKELAEYRVGDNGIKGMLLWGNQNYVYNELTMGYTQNVSIANGYFRSRGWNVPNLITYMESHDEQWLMYKNLRFGACNTAPGGGPACDGFTSTYNVRHLDTALDRQKMAGAFFFTIPGPKMLWQFGELGYGGGPGECLKPGDGTNGDCSASDPGRTSNKPVRWEYYDDEDRNLLYRTWAAMLRLRKEHPVFHSSETTATFSGTGAVKQIRLSHPEMNVTIVGNFGVTNQSSTITFSSDGTWYDYFTNSTLQVSSGSHTKTMLPGQFHIYTSVELPLPNLEIPTSLDRYDGEIPAKFGLYPNYPNPFNPTTTVTYDLPESTFVQIKVFDVLGRQVAELVNQNQDSGTHSIQFNAWNLSSGTYLIRMEAGGNVFTNKMLLIK
jgi:glycosidase